MKYELTQTLKILLAAFVLTFGMNYVYAWTAPTANPPGGNVNAPINTGAIGQTKTGNLDIASTLSAVNGIFTGNVGINDLLPDSGEQDLLLDVNGAVGAAYYCDENGNNCVTAADLYSLVYGGGSPPPSPCVPDSVEYTIPGSYNFLLPSCATALKISMSGGGGGGGIGTWDWTYQGGTGGGGGGGFQETIINQDFSGQVLSVTVGDGGACSISGTNSVISVGGAILIGNGGIAGNNCYSDSNDWCTSGGTGGSWSVTGVSGIVGVDGGNGSAVFDATGGGGGGAAHLGGGNGSVSALTCSARTSGGPGGGTGGARGHCGNPIPTPGVIGGGGGGAGDNQTAFGTSANVNDCKGGDGYVKVEWGF